MKRPHPAEIVLLAAGAGMVAYGVRILVDIDHDQGELTLYGTFMVCAGLAFAVLAYFVWKMPRR